MESKCYFEKENGKEQSTYDNEIYKLEISNDGNTNLGLKTNDNNAVIYQLVEDLSRATIKMQNILKVIDILEKGGNIPSGVFDKVYQSIYEKNDNNVLKR